MRARTRKGYIGLALICIGVLALWICLLPGNNDLLRLARPIARVKVSPPGNTLLMQSASAMTGPCFWLSDREAIAFRVAADSIRYEPWRIEAATGAQQPFQTLERGMGDLFRSSGVSWLSIGPILPGKLREGQLVLDCPISPDGKWLLWNGMNGQGDFACALDGSRNIRFARPVYFTQSGWPAAAWMPDSRHWVQIGPSRQWQARLRLFSLDDPDRVQDFDLASQQTISGAAQLLGVTRSDDLLVLPVPGGWTAGLDLQAYTLPTQANAGRILTPKNLHIALPPKNSVLPVRIALSPAGDRLTFFVISFVDTPHQALLRKFWGMLGRHPHYVIALWTCRPDGKERQEIGEMPYKVDEETPTDLRWLPGGKRLSFLYKGTLYTVPAN